MEPMDLLEAMKWSEKNSESIKLENDNSPLEYRSSKGILEFLNGSTWVDEICFTTYLLESTWTPWQEQREYFTYLEAMTLMNDESNVLKYDVPSCFDFEYIGKSGVPYARDGDTDHLVRFGPEHFESKWYIVTPAPEPETNCQPGWFVDYYSIPEIAAKIGVCDNTVRRYIKCYSDFFTSTRIRNRVTQYTGAVDVARDITQWYSVGFRKSVIRTKLAEKYSVTY